MKIAEWLSRALPAGRGPFIQDRCSIMEHWWLQESHRDRGARTSMACRSLIRYRMLRKRKG